MRLDQFSRGQLIVIYGINNLGKTTQARLLIDAIGRYRGGLFNSPPMQAKYLKYPLYDLEPTGPMINDYLRKGNPLGLSPREFQMLNVQNRLAFQPQLQKILFGVIRGHTGTNIVAEDYMGTGIAWGMGAGVSKDFLVKLNQDLVEPDLAFLFDGKRFSEATERGHTHEMNDDLTERVRKIHLELAQEFGWHVIDANRPPEVIHEEIWSMVRPILRA